MKESSLKGVRDSLLEKVRTLPQKPGVYLFKNQRGKVIYIGKSASLRDRVSSYFHSPGSFPLPKIQRLVSQIQDVEFRVTTSEFDALILEADFIKKFQPRYNTQFKDNKNFPYIKFTEETYPRISLVRKVSDDGGRYFGPYTNARNVRQTIKFLERTFSLRPCHYHLDKEKAKACIYYQMNQCPAPCEGWISPQDYSALVKRAIRFMEGHYDGVLQEIEEKMWQASQNKQYELAALLRDRWKALQHIGERQRVLSSYVESMDAIGIARHGPVACVDMLLLREGRVMSENLFFLEDALGRSIAHILHDFIQQYYPTAVSKPREVLVPELPNDADLLSAWLNLCFIRPSTESQRNTLNTVAENARIKLEDFMAKKMGKLGKRERTALMDLSRVLNLGYLPRRIEGFDISNIRGNQSTGAKVSFYCGRPEKDRYRMYKIQLEGTPDDYAMMEEMLRRRCRKIFDGTEEEPDLILIDGGKGHLNVAVRVLNEFNLLLPVVALAKEQEKVYAPEESRPLPFQAHSPGLHLLMAVRDEAHRFAISYHRTLRTKRLLPG